MNLHTVCMKYAQQLYMKQVVAVPILPFLTAFLAQYHVLGLEWEVLGSIPAVSLFRIL